MKSTNQILLCLVGLVVFATAATAQNWRNADEDPQTNQSMFRPLEDWPSPNDYRAASGKPGHRYWQQRVDYRIEAELDTVAQVLTGSERITYHNNSPDVLNYLWIQLDQNVRSLEHSRSYQSSGALPERIPERARQFFNVDPFDGGDEISRVQLVRKDGSLVDAKYRINGTVMRVDLLEPLNSGESTQLEIDWSFNVPDQARGAKEKVTDGWLYVIAQWYPRLSVYDDVNGWQTDQFLGRGEFYLEFGNFDVKITVPWNHILDATGVLQNPEEVLTREQRNRLADAYTTTTPKFIVAPDEVGDPSTRPVNSGTLTWHFKAEDVRDFSFATSATYVWDAAGYTYNEGETPIAMHSLYPRDAMPVWDLVSTHSIAQTLETYGKMSLKYPYPKAVNANGPVGGMEYPMIAFCGARPRPGMTQEQLNRVENSLIGVTIHEVGHNWFPMIIASDERKYTWMDEGLNTFVEYYAEQDFAKKWQGTELGDQFEDGSFPSFGGPAPLIVGYMRDPDQVPIMTHSDLIHKGFGPNGYTKPASGLVMLREQILGPDAFDDAFREYSSSWAFKHPQPSDFFRTMEEGAGEDLAYFWRGWFYTTLANDQAIVDVVQQDANELLGSTEQGQYYYRVTIKNEGGLLLPVTIQVTYEDDSTERIDLPIDIWRYNELEFTKGFFAKQNVKKVELDPEAVWADIDTENNSWEAFTLDEGEGR